MASIKSTNQEVKKGYLEADLRSLGIEPKIKNELNDKELRPSRQCERFDVSRLQDSLQQERRPIQRRSKIYG